MKKNKKQNKKQQNKTKQNKKKKTHKKTTTQQQQKNTKKQQQQQETTTTTTTKNNRCMYLNKYCHFEHYLQRYNIKHMFSYTLRESKPVISILPDGSSELNKSGKCLTTEIVAKPYEYFSQHKTFLTTHVAHLQYRQWCISQANKCISS